jgi:two-component system sensor histidine kinase CreC
VDNILEISITNQGEPIPEFAFARLTERFFSLPRPATGKKSTGLGLSFVQEVMNLHRGKLELRNTPEGVTASLYFPAP